MKPIVVHPRHLLIGLLSFSSCAPAIELKEPSVEVPERYGLTAGSTDQNSAESGATAHWRDFFPDQHLVDLIQTALSQNQELNIFQQEIEIAKNEVSARSGAYLPSVEIGAEAGIDKVGKYTRFGALEENNEIAPGRSFPEPLKDFRVGPQATWEVDIWRKLRNSEQSAYMKFLSSQEGRRFLVTNLIAEIAGSYYELCALNDQLSIVLQNINLQRHALETVRLQKNAARVTELGVRRFDAQLLKTEALRFDLEQKIVEKENKINFLAGRFPQSIPRDSDDFATKIPQLIKTGLPSQLLQNRTDIRQAKLDIEAADLDVRVAEAAFYPSLTLSAEVGYEAYRLEKLFTTPESLLYGITGGLTGPLLNRRAITADFYNASAKQKQAVFQYERTVLNAFAEASTQISNVQNLERSATLKAKQVDALTSSVEISGTLFFSARADYSEVLLTQREALEARFELVETRLRQMQAVINLYRALGGGWENEQVVS